MYHFLQSTYHSLYQLLFPAHCAQCLQFLSEQKPLCSICLHDLTPVASYMLPLTPSINAKVFAISGYYGALKTLIIQKHWGNRTAATQLGQLMWNHTYIAQQQFDVIVPIPLHWMRYAYRGYNQADEIARVLAQKSGKPKVSALKRMRSTQLQADLTHEQRQKNIKHAFVRDESYCGQIADKHLLLVDDLMTTGATVREAAKVLLTYKPASITVIVAARVL